MAWNEIEMTPHPDFYTSDDNETLYITDTHEGRLRTSADRYHLVYSEGRPDFYRETVDTSDSLEELERSMNEILEGEETTQLEPAA